MSFKDAGPSKLFRMLPFPIVREVFIWITIKIPMFRIPTFIIPIHGYFDRGIGILIGALVL